MEEGREMRIRGEEVGWGRKRGKENGETKVVK